MKRNLSIILVVAVIIAAVVAFWGWRSITASAASTNSRMQTVVVERGTLSATVNAAGNVSAPRTAAFAFQSSGRVAQVAVGVGDHVKKGQLLMQLDTTDLELALKTAQTTFASQQASFDATQASLAFALRTAQANLASAQASDDTAKAKSATGIDQLMAAKITLDQAKSALVQAQGNYDDNAWKGPDGSKKQYLELETATAAYDAALSNFKITAAGVNDASVREAQAAVDSAQVALEQAQKNMDTSLRAAQASLESAKVAVDQAQHNLDNASLYAPSDGTVSAVNYNPGDSAGTSTAVSVVDLSKVQVQVSIAEVDVARIKVGETAQVTMDALPDKTYTGQVIAVGPVGTVTSGVVNYAVTVALTNADAAVKPGLTANLAVEVDRRDNVLVVPTRAIRTQGSQKIATVLQNGKSVEMVVNTGLSNDTMVEITSGLNEGDHVVVNQTQTTQSNRGGGVGIMLPGLGGAGGPPPD
jgi:HlyD family secretion protein